MAVTLGRLVDICVMDPRLPVDPPKESFFEDTRSRAGERGVLGGISPKFSAAIM